MTQKILILVHPGSACGSATFSLGEDEAEKARRTLEADIARWTGHVMVVHGELSDELSDYPALAEAIRACRLRCASHGFLVREIMACALSDEDWDGIVQEALLKLKQEIPGALEASITGAWKSLDDSGCVNTVCEISNTVGIPATMLEGAVMEDFSSSP